MPNFWYARNITNAAEYIYFGNDTGMFLQTSSSDDGCSALHCSRFAYISGECGSRLQEGKCLTCEPQSGTVQNLIKKNEENKWKPKTVTGAGGNVDDRSRNKPTTIHVIVNEHTCISETLLLKLTYPL